MLEDPNAFLAKLQSTPDTHNLKFQKVLGSGKSAVVFLAESGDKLIAIKVYDSVLLRKFGQDIQTERLSRELALQGHACHELVQIYGGGTIEVGAQSFPFLSMEYVEGVDLREHVDTNGRLPDMEIRKHLRNLIRASGFLHSQGLCHRDIKTDNCRLRTDGSLVLLDLGVIKPIAQSDLTDVPSDPKSRYFLGTLRYAPPEYLLRRESDSPDGWRAVTTYQIGAVLYEMIQGSILFAHIREPYAELVQAVLHFPPELLRHDVGADLVKLARSCLIKDPAERLRQVPWNKLSQVAEAQPESIPDPGKYDITSILQAAAEDYARGVETPAREAQRKREARMKVLRDSQAAVTAGLRLPALDVVKAELLTVPGETTVCLWVPANLKLGFPYPLRLVCRLQMAVDAQETVRIDALGSFGDLPTPPPALQRQHMYRQPEKAQELVLLLQVLSYHNALRFFEVLWDEPAVANEITDRIHAWAETMAHRYLTLVEGDRNRLLETERRTAEQLARTGFAMTEGGHVCRIFNQTQIVDLR